MSPACETWSGWRVVGLMAALFALVLATLLPSAVMATARPGEAVVLCTAEGPRTISVDDDGKAPALDGSACAACVLAHATILPEPPTPRAVRIQVPSVEVPWTMTVARLQPPSRAPPRPPSTAPPLA